MRNLLRWRGRMPNAHVRRAFRLYDPTKDAIGITASGASFIRWPRRIDG